MDGYVVCVKLLFSLPVKHSMITVEISDIVCTCARVRMHLLVGNVHEGHIDAHLNRMYVLAISIIFVQNWSR
jgi:hypothetical protein